MKRIALVAASALLLAGCAANPAADEGDALPQVVASINVYGNIASAVGREHIEVTNIISAVSQDPHSYEASAQDRKSVDDAALVILNGGGYDPFMDTLVEASANDIHVISAVEVSGLLPEGAVGHVHERGEAHSEDEEGTHEQEHIEGFNEHVWYSFPAMQNLANEIAHELGELDPDNADEYTSNAAEFVTQVDGLQAEAQRLAGYAMGKGAALTEPVPGYLIEAVGLVNLTPPSFTEAIEEGTDVPPQALQETLDLITSKSVLMLGYNEQTTSPETERVLEAAETAEVRVVSFTELLPAGLDYVSWMQRNNLAQLGEVIT